MERERERQKNSTPDGDCDCCSGFLRYSSQSAEQPVLWRLLRRWLRPLGWPGLPVPLRSLRGSPLSPPLCSACFLLFHAGSYVQLRLTGDQALRSSYYRSGRRLSEAHTTAWAARCSSDLQGIRLTEAQTTAPPALTVLSLHRAWAEPALFDGEWEGLDGGGEGGRKGGERVELRELEREVNQCLGCLLWGDGASPTAGYPLVAPHSLHPTSPAALGGGPSQPKGRGGEGRGRDGGKLWKLLFAAREGGRIRAGCTFTLGTQVVENAWLLGCPLCRAKARACVPPLGATVAACCLRLLLKFNSFALCYRSFIFLMMCASLAIPLAVLTPAREQASISHTKDT